MDINITNIKLILNLNITKKIKKVNINICGIKTIELNERELFNDNNIIFNDVVIFLNDIVGDLTQVCDFKNGFICTITIFYYSTSIITYIFEQKEIQRFSLPIKINDLFSVHDYCYDAGSIKVNCKYNFSKPTLEKNYQNKYVILPVQLIDNFDNLDLQANELIKLYNINTDQTIPPFISNIRISNDQYDKGIYVFFTDKHNTQIPIVRRETIVKCNGHYSSCWDFDAQILTTKGWKQSTDITISDIVITDVGQSEIISIEVSKKEIYNMYKINDVLLTSGHPYLLNDKWVRPDETGIKINNNFESIDVYNLNLKNDHCVFLKSKYNFDSDKILVATNGKFSNWYDDTKPLKN